MKKFQPLIFLVLVVLAGCSLKDNTKGNNDTLINFAQYSESVKDTFYINVQLPEDYFKNPSKKYPTVFLVDGNFFFPMMASIVNQYETASLLEPKILIGIGYKSFQTMDSLRVRDYLYPKALPTDEMTTPGGGQNFYNYLTRELIPEIDSQYRTEKTNRALLGHSFGGYFVLYSLLNQLKNKTNDFKTFISASPTLWYNNFYLNQLPEQLSKNNAQFKIFLSVGEMEDSTWSVKPVVNLAAAVQKQEVKGLEFKSRVYNHLDHMDVAVLSFTKGLQELQ